MEGKGLEAGFLLSVFKAKQRATVEWPKKSGGVAGQRLVGRRLRPRDEFSSCGPQSGCIKTALPRSDGDHDIGMAVMASTKRCSLL